MAIGNQHDDTEMMVADQIAKCNYHIIMNRRTVAEAQRRQERREREARHEPPEAGAEVSAAGAFLSERMCGGAVIV